MKILQINTVAEFGSTGRTCSELSLILEDKGHNSYIAYGHGTAQLINRFKIGSRFSNHLHNIFSRLLGNQGYYSKNGTKKLIRFIQEIEPDIIHLRNLHGNYINLEILFKFLADSNIPVVWTLHDCWPYTGKCTHYTEVKCYKWQTTCKECIQVDKYPRSIYFDRSEFLFNQKKALIENLKDLTIVTVSKWLEEEAKRSFLKDREIITIYNWINQDVFKPLKKVELSKFYELKHSNNIKVLFVSNSWNTNQKRTKYLLELISILNNVEIIIVGKIGKGLKIPKGVNNLNYIKNEKELSRIYNLADVYIHLSIEDTFGKVIAESLSCGTPVITFDTTVYPEMVKKNCGFIVKEGDIEGIAEKINEVRLLTKSHFSEFCTQFARKNFSIKDNSKEYINLYHRIISRKKIK